MGVSWLDGERFQRLRRVMQILRGVTRPILGEGSL